MKMNRLSVLFLLVILLLTGCGKPNDPESIFNSGGYRIISRLSTPAYAQDVILKDSLLYVAQGEGGLLIADVKDPANPQIVSITAENVRGYSDKVAIKDSVVYLAAGTFGITVLDAANPDTPFVTVSNLGLKPARNMHIMGNILFAAVSEQGVKIADITYPTQPDIRGGILTLGYAYDLTTTADSSWLLVACGQMGLSIYNISNFLEGFGVYPLVGWCDTPGYAEALTIVESDSLAYLACGTEGLQIIDYSDSANIHIIGSFSPGGYAKELIYSNKRIFMTAEKLGLQIIDVSDPANPFLIGQVATTYALGLDADEKYIYVADDTGGLVIVSQPETTNRR
jgi:hypothetical protein